MGKIVCSLSNDQQKELLAEVAATIDDLIESKKPFNLKSIVKDFYDFVYEATGEVATAKLYASLVPTNLRLSVVNKKLSKYLVPNLVEISDLEDEIEKDVNYLSKFLGIQEEIEDEDVLKFNEEEAARKAYEEFLQSQPPLPTPTVYSARPSTLFATTGESRVSGTEFSYRFIDNLIENILPSDRSTESITARTGFYVTTASVKDVLREGDDPSGTYKGGVIQIISDSQGNPIYFDDEYNQTTAEQGKPVFFRLREKLDTVQTVEEIANTLGITPEEVETGLDKQYAQVQKVKSFVESGNRVVNIITGASLGYLPIDLSEKKPLKNAEDLSNNNILFDSTKIDDKVYGNVPKQTYLFDRGAHRTPIPFKMNSVTSDSEFLEDSIRILMGDVVDSTGKKDKKLDVVIKKFFTVFYGQNKKIQIIDGVAHVEGKPATEEVLREALTVFAINPRTKKPTYNTYNLYVDYAKGSIPFYTKDDKGVIKMTKKGLGPIQYRKFIQEHAYTGANYNDRGEFREENGYLVFDTPVDELNKIDNAPASNEAPVSGANNPAEYTNHSGGAVGADSMFDTIGKEYGQTNHKHYYYGSKTPKGNVLLTEEQVKEGVAEMNKAAEILGRKPSKQSTINLLARNWFQVKNSTQVVAVAPIDESMKFVEGGTGWAVAMAQANGKEINVFNLKDNKWYKWDGTTFIESAVPVLAKNFAGIGSRQDKGKMTPESIQAIRDVYANTFKASTQAPVTEPAKKKGKKKKETTPQQLELGFTPPPPPPSPTDFSVDDYLTKFKRKNQKGELVSLTQQEIDNIKGWWGKSPLSNHVSLQVMFEFANRSAVGQFVLSPEVAAIYLYNGSDYTDLYHESFHAFFEMFTTPQEREDIYETAKKLEGSFVNTNGDRVNFSNASKEDLDEYLADDFQDFMVEQDKKIENKERNSKIQSFFKSLLEVLKELFNISVEDSTNILTPSKKLQELYTKIRNNEIVYRGQPSDKGFRVFDKIKSIDETSDSASYSSSKRITDAMAALVSQFVDNADKAQVGKFKRYSATIMSSPASQVYVFNYVRQELLKKRAEMAEKLAKIPREKETVSVKFSKGDVIISKADIANYKDVVKKYNKIPKEFFTPDTLFSVFYDNNTGKRGKAPQSSIWVRNDYGYYDLVEQQTGEIYIENVDLKTGTQMQGDVKVKMVPSIEYQRAYELYEDLDFAIKNFAPDSRNGEIITEESIKQAKETDKGTIAYYLKKNKHVSIEEVYESVDPSKTGTEAGRADFRDRSGNEVSSQELASKELTSILSSLFEYTADNKLVTDEYGFPKTIPFELAWNKVLKTIGGKKSAREMYDELAKKGKTDKAVEQFLSKIGFYEPVSDDNVDLRQINLWSDVYHIFSMPRIPLVSHTINITENSKGIMEGISVDVSRSKGNTRNIKRDWDNLFVASNAKNPFVVKKADVQLELNDVPFTGNFLNIPKVLAEFNKDYADRPIEFLRALGMNVSDTDEARAALSSKGMGSLRIFVRKMHEKLTYISNRNKSETGSGKIFINKPSQLVEYRGKDDENDTGAYQELLELEARYSEKYGTAVVYNASNDLQFEYSLPSTLSKRIGFLNGAGSYGDLVADPRMKYLDVRDNPMARGLAMLEELYGEGYDVYDDATRDFKKTTKTRVSRKGGRVANSEIRLSNSAGVSLAVNEQFANLGVKTFNTDEDAFTLQSFHMFLKTGLHFGIQHSDKTTTYLYELYRSSGQKNYIPTEDFTDYADYETDPTVASLYSEGMTAAVNRMKQYLSNEIAFMYRIKNGDPAGNMIAGKATLAEMSDDFYVFWDILTTETKNKIKEKYMSDNFLEEFGDETDLMENIENEIAQYFVSLALRNYNLLKETGGLDVDAIMDPFRAKLLASTDVSDDLAENLDYLDWSMIQSFTVNDWIHKFETTVILYGNPQLFDDPFKRDAGNAGTGEIPRTDDSMNSILNKYFAPEYSKSKWYQASGLEQPAATQYGITASTAILQDPEIESPKFHYYVNLAIEEELQKLGVDSLSAEQVNEIMDKFSEYKKMKIGDGQGWCTFDFYRALSIRLRKWGPYQESLYKKILAGQTIKDSSKFFPVLKLQYWGSLETENQLPGIGFHKFSVFPLVPNVIKNSKLETLHNKMVSQGLDYAAFLSASKINTITTDGKVDKFYDDPKTLGPLAITDPDYVFTKNNIFLDYLKNQQEQTDMFKGKTVMSTQLRTTALMNLYKEGIPSSFMPNQDNNIEREQAWEELTESQRLAYPSYRANKVYKAAVDAYSARLKSDFLKEAGVEENPDGTYEVSNKLISYIQKQLSDREKLGEHEIEFLSKISDFSLHFNSEEIEKMIMSLVYKRIINQKVNGEPLVQVSSAGFESADNAGLRNATQEEQINYGALDLNFYTEGKAMKVKIAIQGSYKLLLEHRDVKRMVERSNGAMDELAALNALIKDEDWLNEGENRKMITLAGVRIPVQGLNSVEWAEVYEFLPENAGNMVIVPPEIVAKSGSDFDIDKLFMMFPNLIKVGNRIELVTYDASEVANLEENKRTLKELYDELETEYDLLEQKFLSEKDGLLVDERKIIFESIERYKAEKQNIKEILFSGNYELSDEDKNELHERLHAINRQMTPMYSEMSSISQEIKDYMDNVIIPISDEILNLKRKIAAASTKGMQNNMMFSIIDIISLPENFIEFITPNGTYFVKPLADDLQKYLIDESEANNITNNEEFKRAGKSAMIGTRLFEFNINNKRRSENNISKGVLGMGAVHNKYHSVKNIANAYLQPSIVLTDKDTGADFEIMQTIKMPHNIQYVATESAEGPEYVPAVSLSAVYDVNKKLKISDINSQMINGWVDVAKDAWIFYVQGNKELTPVLELLIDAGVDVEQAVLFVSQPLIRKYAGLQRKIKGAYAKPLGIFGANSNRFRDFAKSQIMTDYLVNFTPENLISPTDIEDLSVGNVTFSILTKYAPEIFDRAELDDVEGFSVEDLKSRIVEYSEDETKRTPTLYDYAAFAHFIELEEMSKADTQVKLTTNDDVMKIGTIYEMLSRQKSYSQALLNDRLRPGLISDIMDKTILGSFHIGQNDVLTNVMQSMFELSSHPQFIKFLSTIDRSFSDYKISKEFPGAFKDKEDFLSALRNDFKVYVLQDYLFNSTRFDITAPYKGYKIDSTHPVKRTISLTQGVAMSKDGTLYIDEGVINNDVANPEKTYLNNEEQVGVRRQAPFSMDYFQNTNTQIHKTLYVKFLYERELLRSNIPFEDYSQTKDFKVRMRSAKKYEKDLKEKYKMTPEEYVYESFLRDTALLDKLNIEFMLRDKENGYGAMFERLLSTHPRLADQYPILLSLRTTVNNDTRNLILSEPVLTPELRNDYHDQIVRLSDETYKKVDNDLDNRLISNFFSKLSFFALFQSGYTGKGNYNLSSVYPLDHYNVLIEQAKQKAMGVLNGDKKKKAEPYLEKFMEMFKMQYKVGGYDEDTGIVTPYRVKRVKDYNNDVFYEEPKKGFLRAAPYNSSLLLFKAPSDPKSFFKTLSLDKNNKIVYASEASLSPSSDENVSSIGKFITSSIFQDAVFQKVMPAEKVRALVTKKTGIVYEDADFITDADYETSKAAIDVWIDGMKADKAAGKILVFSPLGYGKVYLGYGGNEQAVAGNKLYSKGRPAPKTFVYLSKRLLELGYVNPLFDKMADFQEVIETQPFTNEDVKENRRQCYKSLYDNG
jgi:hypothetical protein